MATLVTRSGRLDDGYNIDSALKRILVRLGEIVRYDHASVLLRDAMTGQMSIAAEQGMALDIDTLNRLLAEGRGFVHQVLTSGRARIVGDTKRITEYVSVLSERDDEETRTGHSRVLLPLSIEGEIIGVLNLENLTAEAYTIADLRMLNPLADIVATVLRSARHQRRLRDEHYTLQQAYATLDERSQSLTVELEVLRSAQPPSVPTPDMSTLQHVVELINSNYQRGKMLQAMADALISEFGFERSVVLLSHGDQMLAEVGAEQGKEPAKPTLRVSTRDDAARWAMFTVQRRAVWSEGGSNTLGAGLLQRLRLREAVLMPLVVRGKLLGMVVAGNRQPSTTLNPDHLQVYTLLGSYAGAAIENVRLFQETQRRAAEQDILYRTVNDIVSHRNLQQLLPVIITRAVTLLNAESGMIYISSKQKRLEVVACHNLFPEPLGDSLGEGEGLAGRVMRDKRAVRITDYSKWTGREARYEGLNFGATLGVPLISKNGELIGVLCVIAKHDGRILDDSDERLLTLFAGQAATVMETVHLYTSLKQTNDELQKVSSMKSEFVANMSHELRTPLNSIIGYTEMMLQGFYGDLSEKQETALNKVVKAAKNLLQLITDVLDVSKIESGKFELNDQPFSPRELLDISVSMVETQAEQKGIKLITEVDALLPRQLMGDQQRLQQVLLNLVANAVKFTDVGSVTVKFQMVGTALWAMTVRDTGVGLEESDYQRIFDEFLQVDGSSTRRHSGTGLGLAITRRLIHAMNGTVNVFSKGLGQGSTFTVTLPLVEPVDMRRPKESHWHEESTARPDQVAFETVRIRGNTLRLAEGEMQLQESAAGTRLEELVPEVPAALGREVAAAAQQEMAAAVRQQEEAAWSRKTGPLFPPPEEGMGEMITIAPVASSILKADGAQEWRIERETASPAAGVRPIIVVDDDDQARDVISRVLRREGHVVVCAANLAEAATMINQTTPSLMVIDLNLSGESGVELARVMRGVERTSRVPILLVTADGSTQVADAESLVNHILNKSHILSGELRDLVRTLNQQGDALKGEEQER